MGAEGHATLLGGQARRGWALSGEEGTAPPLPWPSFLGDACGGGGALWTGHCRRLLAARGHSQAVLPSARQLGPQAG